MFVSNEVAFDGYEGGGDVEHGSYVLRIPATGVPVLVPGAGLVTVVSFAMQV
jgi:hypothetical protein